MTDEDFDEWERVCRRRSLDSQSDLIDALVFSEPLSKEAHEARRNQKNFFTKLTKKRNELLYVVDIASLEEKKRGNQLFRQAEKEWRKQKKSSKS